jgi:hypothetical protein
MYAQTAASMATMAQLTTTPTSSWADSVTPLLLLLSFSAVDVEAMVGDVGAPAPGVGVDEEDEEEDVGRCDVWWVAVTVRVVSPSDTVNVKVVVVSAGAAVWRAEGGAADGFLPARINTAAAAIIGGRPATNVPKVSALGLAYPAWGADGHLCQRHGDTSWASLHSAHSTRGKLGISGNCAVKSTKMGGIVPRMLSWARERAGTGLARESDGS